MNDSGRRAAVVIGAGDATGGAIAKRFAQGGYAAVVTRRKAERLQGLAKRMRGEGLEVHPFGVDARVEDEMVPFFEKVEKEIAPIGVMVFNIGANVNFPILETTTRVYYKVWKMGCFAGFLSGREAARHMLSREQGTILFTGATASVTGRQGFSAFAGAKFGLRALAQSMARELGPKGIHVAHSVIDGPIDTAFIRENMQSMLKDRPYAPNLLDPDAIAEAYWTVHQQPKSAWAHEFDLRPWAEPW